MSVIGSLIFCTDCGNLLRESTGNADAILHCDVCGTRNKGGWTKTFHILPRPIGGSLLTSICRYNSCDNRI
ncbi:DNA-directed RNA polymerase subunit [Penicillium digitatum PHI26]|uniref:DNA-directed RNA polymerase subunit n=2 Tax=Penicillium digitatum TaxID=36651 RepID=K9FWX5_PEND2|nr:DNA-directed RNA polymerase subunit [Penicillium digitatum Pd1]EKV04581.1 DNA-directed RNA polymerase subunit [Penicillium digitatum Pd1]EKV05546.1 DNA-directed RNA polymerase subunit [Penicillium digitatum PHI26]